MTGTVERLLTEHLDTWTAAVETKSAAGRGSSKKLKLVGIAKLRELILELAVRGQLVPQDESDEPASVLLERIAAERERLVKEKKIKKPKVLPEISEEEKTFDLPVGWDWARIGFVALHNAGKTLDKGRNSGDLRDYITTSNLYWGRFELSEVKQMPIKKEELDKCLATKGDLLICEGGEAGRASVWLKDYDICFQNHVHRVRFFGGFNAFYAYRFFEKINFTGEINQHRKGVAISNMSGKALSLIVLPVPPLNEQNRIVEKVDELMALCDALEQEQESSVAAHGLLVENLLATLTNAADKGEFKQAWAKVAAHFDTLFTTEQSVKQLKQTILQLAVMGKLVEQDPADEPAGVLLERIAAEKVRLVEEKVIKKQKALPGISDEEKVFDLPEGWAWCRLGELTNLISGQHLKPQEYSGTKQEDMFPYLTGPADFGDVHPLAVRYTSETRAIAFAGDVLLTCKGSGVGKINVADTEMAISRQLMSVQPLLIDGAYLELLLSSLNGYFQSQSIGIAIPGISREDVTEALVLLPPLSEQRRIKRRVDQLHTLFVQLKSKISITNATRLLVANALTKQVVS